MAFSRRHYERKLKQKELKNPGKANRDLRKARQNAERGERIPGVRIISDKRKRDRDRRARDEIRNS